MKLLIIVLAMLATSVGALHSWYSKGLYVKAALLSDAYVSANAAKSRVSDHFIELGVMPNNNAEANIAAKATKSGSNTLNVTVLQGGVVEVQLPTDKTLGSQSLVFSPFVSPTSGYLYWQCSSDSVDKVVLERLRPTCDHQPVTRGSELMGAIKYRNLKSLDTLVQRKFDLDEYTRGITPLMYAAYIGDVQLVERLIEHGAAVELPANNHDGLSALMIAIRSRQEPIAKLLLERGASTATVDRHNQTARNHAQQIENQSGDSRFVRLLQQTDNPQFQAHPAQSSLGWMVHTPPSYNYEKLRQKIKKLGNECLDTPTRTFNSQLKPHCGTAISELVKPFSDTSEIVLEKLNLIVSELPESILIENVEDFVASAGNAKNEGLGVKPFLNKAISADKPVFAALLIDRGADVNELSADSSRPLIEASKLGNVRLVRKLVNHGADLDAADRFGRTALLSAVDRGHRAIVGSLIQAGAATKKKDANGIDALLLAKTRRFGAIETLLMFPKGTHARSPF